MNWRILFMPWLMWGLGTAFYFYENILQVCPGVMAHDLMHSLQVNAGTLGNIVAFYSYAYAFMQIPVGILADRYGPRLLLTIAIFACVLGSILFATSNTVLQASIGRFFMGFGSAFAAVCTMKLAAHGFSYKKFSFLTGLMITMGMCGSMVGEKPVALLVEHIGWRLSIILLALLGIILAFLTFFLIKEPSTMHKAQNISPIQTSFIKGLLSILQTPQSWIIAIYGGLMFAPTSIFGGLWGVPFIMQAYQLPRPNAAGIVSMLFLGWMIGSPLSGWLVTHFKKNKVLFMASFGALISLCNILYVPFSSPTLLSLNLFYFGLFSSSFLPSFSIMREIHPIYLSGTALGFMNMMNMVGGAIGQPCIGLLLDKFSHSSIKHMHYYTTTQFKVALSLLPIMIAISMLLIPWIPKESSEKTLL